MKDTNHSKRENDLKKKVDKQRFLLLKNFEKLFETPLVILGFVWILLLIAELINKSNPVFEKAGIVIWIIFIIDFLVKFTLAPKKILFLKKNILTIISLIIPAFRVLRVFRVFRLLRLTRGLRLIKLMGSINRAMKALSLTLQRRAFGYITALTLIVLFVGAAGMHAFEHNVNEGLKDYSSALWWTGMILTTMGTDFWPVTTEGRILCVILAIYAFAVFGYVTATIATFFIGKDAEDESTEIASAREIGELKKQLEEIKKILSAK